MSQEDKDMLNGVNVVGLRKTVGNIQENPALAQCEFRVRNQWVNGDENRSDRKSVV